MAHLPVQILSGAQHATLGSVRLHAFVRQGMLQLWRSMLDSLRVHNNLEGAELLVFFFLLQESHLPQLLQLGTGRILG